MTAPAVGPPTALSRAAAPRPPDAPGGFEARLRAHLGEGAFHPGAAPGPAEALVRGVEEAQRRLDGVLSAARAGRTFTAGELLALQADAYRLAQTLDVAGKVVEQGVQSVKQAIATPL